MPMRLACSPIIAPAFEERFCCVLRRTERLIDSGKYVRGLKALYRAAEKDTGKFDYKDLEGVDLFKLRSRGDSLLYLFGDNETQQAIFDFCTGEGKKLVETHSEPEIELIDLALIVRVFDSLQSYGYKVKPEAIIKAIQKVE